MRIFLFIAISWILLKRTSAKYTKRGRWYSVCVWSVLSVRMVTSLSQSDPNEKVDPKYGKVLGIVSETKQNPTKPASTKEPYQDSDCVRTTTETASAFEQLPGQPGSVLRRGKKPD